MYNRKTRELLPKIVEMLKNGNRYKEISQTVGISHPAIGRIARLEGIGVIKGRRFARFPGTANFKLDLPWEDYVRIPGNIAWPDGEEPREEKHQSCSLGVLLQQLEVM